jgi:hypothetical protein
MSDDQGPIYFYTKAMAYWGLSNLRRAKFHAL